MYNPLLADFFKNVGCVGFLGLGKSNLAVLSLLPKDIKVVLRSECSILKKDIPKRVKPLKIFDGLQAFDEPIEDILFLSPSVRRERKELKKMWDAGVVPSSDLELFLYANKKKLFSVTGSDGKSTTATLAAALLTSNRSSAGPIGNVGTPFVKSLSRSGKYAVAELSSFSLQYSVPHSHRAVVTNITPNHLNWHKDYEEYREAKISLLNSADETVISADDDYIAKYAESNKVFAITSVKKGYEELRQRFDASVYYTVESGCIKRNGAPILLISSLTRRENHIIKNILSSLALTDGYCSNERMIRVASEFRGLPHRLEEVAVHNGIKYINSSIDTSPQRCSESLSSLTGKAVLILGGRGKGLSYEQLRDPLAKHVKLAVITGENREEIRSDIKGCVDIALIEDFEDAVLYAASAADVGDTVLLSPASVSFDNFQSFEERGNKFKEIILNYIKNTEK